MLTLGEEGSDVPKKTPTSRLLEPESLQALYPQSLLCNDNLAMIKWVEVTREEPAPQCQELQRSRVQTWVGL